MKRFLIALLLACLGSSLWAATIYYVDGSCSSDAANGLAAGTCTGDAGTCACSGTGPKKTIAAGIGLLTTAGDKLIIRGTRVGSIFHGRYGADQNLISGKNGASGNPIVIENYGYTGILGGGEQVYIEATGLPGTSSTKGWNQCPSDCSGTCAGIPAPCADVWWTDKNQTGNPGFMGKMAGAQRPSGACTAYRATAGALTAQYEHWNNGSYADNSKLFVRWGSATPGSVSNPYPSVFFDNNGYGFFIQSSTFITIRGLNLRGSRRALIQTTSTASDIIAEFNRYSYSVDFTGNESDRPFTTDRTNKVWVQDSEFSCNRSEPIHTQARSSDAATEIHLLRNWIHDNGTGYCPEMGAITGGTPQLLTLTISSECGTSCGSGNYTGSEVVGNLLERVLVNGSNNGRGIVLENNSYGWTIRDNIIRNIEGDCIRLEAQSTGGTDPHKASNNLIYNNILAYCNEGGQDQGGLNIKAGAGAEAKDNLIYNNTLYRAPIVTSDISGTNTGNKIFNNLLLDFAWTGTKPINWTAGGSSAGNEFKNNGIWAQASNAPATGTIATVSTISASCTSLSGSFDLDGPTIGSNDFNLCPLSASPQGFGFTTTDIAALDLRLHATSPANDAGTLAGMPARTGIHNTLAAAHGLPNYTRLQTIDIAAAPDMGAYENALLDGGFESGSIDAPWLSPIGDFSHICTPTSVATIGSIVGGKSLNLTAGPCFDALCFGCRSPFVQQCITGLDTTRLYSLHGKWKLLSGTASDESRIDFVVCETPPCTQNECLNPVPCSATISGLAGETIDFTCPSFMTPSASTMTIAIVPCIAPVSGGMTLAVDDLELR